MTKIKLLMGASALVAAAVAGPASATTAPVYGGGGSLVALAFRQAADCFGSPTSFILENSATTAATLQTFGQFYYQGHLAPYTAAAGPNAPTAGYNCAAEVSSTPSTAGDGPLNANDVVYYISSGSGAGGASFLSHETTAFWGDVTGLGPISGAGSPYPDIHFAESDAGLGSADIAIYNNGGIDATFKNVSIQGSGCTASAGCTYPTPAPLYGPVIQIPLLVTPVTLAYDPIYKRVENGTGGITAYTFNLAHPNVDGSGGLPLDITAVCEIANGVITNWNDPYLKSLNGGHSLRNTADPEAEGTPSTPGTWEYTGTGGGLPIELVGRADASGTTSIFNRSMAAQCTMISGIATNFPTTGGLNLSAPITNTSGTGGTIGTGGFTPQAGKWGLVKNSQGVANYIAFTAVPTAFDTTKTSGKLGYLSPDYVWPAVQYGGFGLSTASYHLDAADYVNGTHRIEPTVAATGLAFGAVLPPQATSAGIYNGGHAGTLNTTNGVRSDPTAWVLPISTTLPGGANNPLAFAPAAALAYPFVGTTQMFLYSCYNETAYPGVSAEIKSFLGYWFTNPIMTDSTKGLLAENGFLPMPAAWKKAIVQTFAAPVATPPADETITTSLAPQAAGYGGTSFNAGTAVHPTWLPGQNQCATFSASSGA
jgi:ABC-type phosphate transport system substrate-binding protein